MTYQFTLYGTAGSKKDLAQALRFALRLIDDGQMAGSSRTEGYHVNLRTIAQPENRSKISQIRG